MAATRIYVVKNKETGAERLVEGMNPSAVVRHVAQVFEAAPAGQQDLVRLLGAGKVVEKVGAETAGAVA